MDPFMSQNTVSMISFTDCRARNFFLPESQCVYIPWTIIPTKGRSGKSMFDSFETILWLKHALQ